MYVAIESTMHGAQGFKRTCDFSCYRFETSNIYMGYVVHMYTVSLPWANLSWHASDRLFSLSRISRVYCLIR